MSKKIGLLLLLSGIFSFLSAVEIKHLREFPLSQEGEILIAKAYSFVVTKDDQVMVADMKASNIKIFDMTGKRLSVFGRNGLGPNEFVRPVRTAYREPLIAIMDFGRRAVFVYNRTEGNQFDPAHKFLCLDLGDDFHLLNDSNVIIAGYKVDKNHKSFHLYCYNFKKRKRSF